MLSLVSVSIVVCKISNAQQCLINNEFVEVSWV